MAKASAGYELMKVQLGQDPSDWKPLRSIGPGVREIRIRVGTIYRILYLASLGDAVYVLHAFEKRTQKTSVRDVDLASSRLKSLMAERRAAEREHRRKP